MGVNQPSAQKKVLTRGSNSTWYAVNQVMGGQAIFMLDMEQIGYRRSSFGYFFIVLMQIAERRI